MAVLMVLISMLGSCTCGSGTVKNGVEYNTPTKMSMLYEEFTGYKQTNINVEAGKPVVVVVSIVTEKGSIDAYIAKDNDIANSSYQGNDVPTMSFTVTLTEAGKYTVRVDAQKHTGSYSFSWETSITSGFKYQRQLARHFIYCLYNKKGLAYFYACSFFNAEKPPVRAASLFVYRFLYFYRTILRIRCALVAVAIVLCYQCSAFIAGNSSVICFFGFLFFIIYFGSFRGKRSAGCPHADTDSQTHDSEFHPEFILRVTGEKTAGNACYHSPHGEIGNFFTAQNKTERNVDNQSD
jgi:hypothetical protein